MIDAILELSLDLPARALDQCWNLICRYVPLPPPGSDAASVVNAKSDRRGIARVDGVPDEHRAWCADLSKPREQLAIPIPGASEAEVAAQEEDGSPVAVGGRTVQVAEPHITHAAKAAGLDRAWRCVHGRDLEPSILEVQRSASCTASEVQSRPRGDER